MGRNFKHKEGDKTSFTHGGDGDGDAYGYEGS